MPELDATTLTKIDDLRTISNNWSEAIEVYQILAIYWDTAGTKYYSNSRPDLTTTNCPVSPIESIIIPDDETEFFFPLAKEGSLSDEEIDIEIFDTDGTFADLVESEGEGIKSEVYFWIPAVELYLPRFWGHLRVEDGSDEFITKIKLASGFRSPDLPMPGRPHFDECQAVYGKLLDNQTAIDESGCPHNKHLPGGTIGNDTFATCPQLEPQNCTDRGINPLFHLSHQSVNVTLINGQTRGPDLQSRSRGNETNLEKAVRVIMGRRRVYDMEVLAFRRDYNNNHPNQGWFDAMYEVGEGQIKSISQANVNGRNVEAHHYFQRLGAFGQTAYSTISAHGYSGTAWLRFNYGQVNPGDINPDNMRASAIIEGLNNIRVYSDENTFAYEYTKSRIWQIAKMLTAKIWGYGLDYDRLSIASLLECEAIEDYVEFTDDESSVWGYYRGESNVELLERTTQQQIEDMCWAGRLSKPFLFNGEIHIIPLKPLTQTELDDAPVFTDTGVNRNIIVQEKSINGASAEVSTLKRSKLSDEDLPNRIDATFDDKDKEWKNVPGVPVQDYTQQLKAGAVLGDTTRRKITKKYNYLGVTDKNEQVALSHHLLFFGEFEEGGTLNNLEISFDVFFIDAFELHEFKVIKVESAQLTRYGFDYFRIKKIEEKSNLHITVTAQAYNRTELDNFEVSATPPVEPPIEPPIELPCFLTFGAITYEEGMLTVPIPCI